MNDTIEERWDENDSQHFIDYGAYFVPEREVQIGTIVAAMPPPDAGALLVEICSGEGLLARALAEKFPDVRLLALDGSEKMLAATAEKLDATGVQFDTAVMDINDRNWRQFSQPVHAFVSSLAIHHLNGAGKQQLFTDLFAALAPGGALVVCDLVEATTPETLILWRAHWDEGVRQRSFELDGDTGMLDFFRDDGWNYYADPDGDPVDMPSTLFEQLGWLAQAGFEHVDVHWLKAGHAIFSGRRPSQS